MNTPINGKSTLQVLDFLIEHDPDASDEQLADVFSEWGHLLDERPVVDDDSAPGEDSSGGAERHL